MFSPPAWNAVLNAASGVLLLFGYAMIRRGRVFAHKTAMLSAVGCSAIFLVNYVVYHARHGVIRFTGQGVIRPVYFTILISHTILAIAIVPLVIVTVIRALRHRFDRHKAIARRTLPIWLYVSFTGVIVYFLLYQIYAPHA
ncbi:MAG TPA: DUF420 domain-containing protein [Methylomirabilota bacterium]|nr:DUF420 domain-containing protein [Methylomirabilota bacterium]